jgi:hypothetical protein
MTRLTKNQLLAMKAQMQAGTPPESVVLPAPIRKKRDNAEFRVQSAFVRKWRANCQSLGIAQCLGFHVPNGSVMGGGNADWQKKERQIRGRLQKLAGVEDGVSDWLLLVPAGKWSGLIIEFKKPGGIVSDEQELFMGYATARGYKCAVHDDADEAWRELLEYINQ